MRRLYVPKELEQRLAKEAKQKELKGERANAYIYGTLRKAGWKPNRELHKERKGKA
jgi:hypothetical protein